MTYDADDAGNFTACNTDYASDKGLAALKAIINLHKSPAFVNGFAANNATNFAAIVDGTWMLKRLRVYLATLMLVQSFRSSQWTEQIISLADSADLSSWVAVKPQTDANKMQVCMAMAQFLFRSEETQLARYKAVSCV